MPIKYPKTNKRNRPDPIYPLSQDEDIPQTQKTNIQSPTTQKNSQLSPPQPHLKKERPQEKQMPQ